DRLLRHRKRLRLVAAPDPAWIGHYANSPCSFMASPISPLTLSFCCMKACTGLSLPVAIFIQSSVDAINVVFGLCAAPGDTVAAPSAIFNVQDSPVRSNWYVALSPAVFSGLDLAGLEALIDAQPIDRHPSQPVPVFVIELEIGVEPGLESPGRVRLVPGRPVDAAPQQRGHLLLEGGEHRLLVAEVEVERPLGEAGQLHDRTNGGGVVAVTLEDPAGRLQQLAASNPLALGEGRFRDRAATD